MPDAPTEQARLEVPLVDEVFQESGPFDHTDLYFYPDLFQIALNDCRSVLAQVISLIRDDGELKGFAVFLEDTGPVCRPSSLPQPASAWLFQDRTEISSH